MFLIILIIIIVIIIIIIIMIIIAAPVSIEATEKLRQLWNEIVPVLRAASQKSFQDMADDELEQLKASADEKHWLECTGVSDSDPKLKGQLSILHR
eukprot:9191407-Karenia_brevis.AAC.1